MKVPTNRSKFMDELRTNLEDVIPAAFQRSYLVKRNISKLVGREAYIEYTEENAPQHLEIREYGNNKNKVCIEFCKDDDCLIIYVDGEYRTSYEFNTYKNKTSYTAAIAIAVARIIR